MKLILIIVSNEDANNVSNALLKEKYFVTKLATTGGLLMNGNTTLLIGTDNEKVEHVVSIVGEVAKGRKQALPSAEPDEFSMFTSFPVEVKVGGATIFVLNVDNFYKI